MPFAKKLPAALDKQLQQLRDIMPPGMDVVIREFNLGNGQRAAAFFIDGLANKELLGRDFFAPLLDLPPQKFYSVQELMEDTLRLGEIQLSGDLRFIVDMVLQGLTALFVDGNREAIIVEAIGWQMRSVNEPSTDVVIRGSREGFVEALRINVSMVRRRLHHPDLIVEEMNIGRYSRTDIAIMYVSSIVDRRALSLLRQRLEQIDIDAVLDSGYIEQLIEDAPYSLFPTIGITEKPDIAAGKMLDGRIVVLVDGSPIALTLPMLFIEGLHSAEDNYTRFYSASWARLVRTISLILSIFLPGFYTAVVSYHQQLIPVKMLLSVAASEINTPYSVGLSMLIITAIYEILREAGVRLPKPAGQAIGIVGAIIMGDAAVNAGIISAPVLIVQALTVTASYVSTQYIDAVTLLRILFLLLGWWFGLLGMLMGSLFMLFYLCYLQSFGVPYLSPIAPLDTLTLPDTFVRFPRWMLQWRPQRLSWNRRRMRAGQRPGRGHIDA
ncbi:MAG: spore germination protein [Firmicutes bacterium]|nr:spore germination protein [Bacillota bacterium]MBQ3111309.1 spore germination protein [Bacillota bacterium]MBQ6842471.1 spore germination protein [Bacillota bacterium]MBR6824201.1 spore germination protein [Bacillota bacterium]